MTHLNQNIAAKLMESVLAAFRSETADLERLAEEERRGEDTHVHRAVCQEANAGDGDDSQYVAGRRGGIS